MNKAISNAVIKGDKRAPLYPGPYDVVRGEQLFTRYDKNGVPYTCDWDGVRKEDLTILPEESFAAEVAAARKAEDEVAAIRKAWGY